MRKATLFVFVLMVVAFAWLVPSQVFAAQPHSYYIIGTDPIEPDRTVRSGECMAKWDMPVPGLMGTRFGFKGSKSLAPLTPIIFPAEYNGKVIPARTQLTLWQCGNGFIPAVALDTSRATGIQCYEAPAPPPPASQPAPVAEPPEKAMPKPTLSLQATLFGQDIAGTKVKRGSRIKISWNSQFTSECHALSGLALNTEGRTTGDFLTPPLKHDETYVFECTGPGGNTSGQIYIDINNHNLAWGLGIGTLAVIIAGSSSGGHHNSTPRQKPTIP